MAAATAGHASVVTLLLDAKADVNQASKVRQDGNFEYFYTTDHLQSALNFYGYAWVSNDF
jgi:hypothetical protein